MKQAHPRTWSGAAELRRQGLAELGRRVVQLRAPDHLAAMADHQPLAWRIAAAASLEAELPDRRRFN